MGGVPHLPVGESTSTCAFCHDPMTFFFQVAFPEKHAWAGKIMTMFACTRCEPQEAVTPSILPVIQSPSDGFLDFY
ncbi:hypothetical protein DES52_116137 [Deinococcus yavapaiensis KR-236]|uniref:Uncharacterized protein n=1 Tax=Deinococcus yavapaiensis KR-236 TaxID=694435 RepID=A0A318S7A5_9DEIO|nr:hypothetical protein DES52_116137 [Deinococcus yavapaiensis KR-236]